MPATGFLRRAGALLLVFELALGAAHLLWPQYRWGQGRDSYFNFSNSLTLASWLASMQSWRSPGAHGGLPSTGAAAASASRGPRNWPWLGAAPSSRSSPRSRRWFALPGSVGAGRAAQPRRVPGLRPLRPGREGPRARRVRGGAGPGGVARRGCVRCGAGWLALWTVDAPPDDRGADHRADRAPAGRRSCRWLDGLSYLAGGTLLLLRRRPLRCWSPARSSRAAAAARGRPAGRPFRERAAGSSVGVGGMTFTGHLPADHPLPAAHHLRRLPPGERNHLDRAPGHLGRQGLIGYISGRSQPVAGDDRREPVAAGVDPGGVRRDDQPHGERPFARFPLAHAAVHLLQRGDRHRAAREPGPTWSISSICSALPSGRCWSAPR